MGRERGTKDSGRHRRATAPAARMAQTNRPAAPARDAPPPRHPATPLPELRAAQLLGPVHPLCTSPASPPAPKAPLARVLWVGLGSAIRFRLKPTLLLAPLPSLPANAS